MPHPQRTSISALLAADVMQSGCRGSEGETAFGETRRARAAMPGDATATLVQASASVAEAAASLTRRELATLRIFLRNLQAYDR